MWRLVTDEFGYQEWRHRCAVCKRWKTVDHFYIRKYKSGNRWDTYCKPCKIAYNRQLIIRDEEQHRAYLEERRIKHRDARERRGLRCYPQKGVKSLTFPIEDFNKQDIELLPVEPIREWLDKKLKDNQWTIVEVSELCDIDVRALHRIREPKTKMVRFSTVDRLLTGEGTTFIWDLYPTEYEELLEAAV